MSPAILEASRNLGTLLTTHNAMRHSITTPHTWRLDDRFTHSIGSSHSLFVQREKFYSCFCGNLFLIDNSPFLRVFLLSDSFNLLLFHLSLSLAHTSPFRFRFRLSSSTAFDFCFRLLRLLE